MTSPKKKSSSKSSSNSTPNTMHVDSNPPITLMDNSQVNSYSFNISSQVEDTSSSVPFQYRIVGTSHVSHESKLNIQKAFNEFHPDLICIELDINRLNGLLSKEKSRLPPSLIFKIGLWGYLFSLIGRSVQEGIGKKLNIVAGDDMLAGVQIAKENNLPLMLIDQNIQITLQSLSRNFRFRDKWNMVKDAFRGILFPQKVMAEIGLTSLDLSKIPSEELIEKTMSMMEKKYPGLYLALVHERNHFMSNRLIEIFKKDPLQKVLVVVGAGHKKGMEEIINQKLLKLEYIK